MNVRELLQKEVWSKRTSRKVLIGFGTVVVGFCVWYALDRHWITPSERNAARAALAQIEVLQNSKEMSDAEYDVRVRRAKESVDKAEQAAWTTRDKLIAAALFLDLAGRDLQRSEQESPHAMSNLLGSLSLEMSRILFEHSLHQALD
jgi:hypothetical protein